MASVHVLIEIDDTEYSVVHEIETTDPIVKTLHKVAETESIPLRTKSGRPYPWTVEGPDVRPGREGGWTDLTRTQTTERIHEWFVEEGIQDADTHLFRIRFSIPGAVDAINEKREAEKIARIEERMAQRAAEREQAEAAERDARLANMGDAEDFTMESSTAAAPMPPPPSASPQPPAPAPPPPPASAPPPPPPPPPPSSAASPAPAPRPAPRPPTPSAPSVAPEPSVDLEDVETMRVDTVPKKRKKKRKVVPPPKTGTPKWVYGAGAGVVLVGGILAFALGGDPPSEPTPEPTPAPTPPPVTDLVVKKKPEATPPPIVEEATPPPVKLETFFSKGRITKFSAKQDAARLTSFAQTDVLVFYKANHAAAGDTHIVELEGRFRVEIGDTSSGIFTGGKAISLPGTIAVGSPTSVSLRFTGKKLTVNVGGKRKTTSIGSSDGFPRWRITVPGDSTLDGFVAKAPPMD